MERLISSCQEHSSGKQHNPILFQITLQWIESANKMLHLTTFPLRSKAAGELIVSS
jgi:hypothetical protein